MSLTKTQLLLSLCEQIVGCRKCELHRKRTNPVCGYGNAEASIMFIGEAPGEQEDSCGIPFTGRCGKYFRKCLSDIGFDTTQCFITNAIRCRPPKNRTPKPDEIEMCQQWLHAQLDIIQPKVIVCVGKVAAQAILRIPSSQSLQSIMNRWHDHWKTGIKTRAIYHPSYIMQHGRKYEQVFRNDLVEILNYVRTY